MKAIRRRIHDLTDSRRWAGMQDIREVIGKLNPVLRGWGGYFRTGNASGKFNAIDRYVRERLVRLLDAARRSASLASRRTPVQSPGVAASPAGRRTRSLSSCWARSDILEARMPHEKTIGKPYAGNPHVRFERGPQETEPARHRA